MTCVLGKVTTHESYLWTALTFSCHSTKLAENLLKLAHSLQMSGPLVALLRRPNTINSPEHRKCRASSMGYGAWKLLFVAFYFLFASTLASEQVLARRILSLQRRRNRLPKMFVGPRRNAAEIWQSNGWVTNCLDGHSLVRSLSRSHRVPAG